MISDRYYSFYQHIDFNKYRSILVLDGELPEASFFNIPLPIIAADGAVNALHLLNITPHAVVGDLDSIHPERLRSTNVIYRPDQNSCDFEKTMVYLTENDYLPPIIVGVSGGYIDHILNNINILLQQGGLFYAPPIVGHIILKNELKIFSLPIHTKISLIGFNQACVSTQGLQWELNHFEMNFPGKNSSFNRTQSQTITITGHSGISLILIYLE